MDVSTVTRDAAIGAAAAVVVPFLLARGPRRIADAIKAKKAREKLRDETLERIARDLKEMKDDQREVGSDVRSLYPIQLVQLESLEISLMAIHGDGLNGNVGDAIKAVRKAKKDITDRVCSKVCADIGEAD